MPVVVAGGLARSRACDGTDALPDVRPHGRVASAAGAFGGVEGRRADGAPARDRTAAAPAPQAEPGLGRPGDTRRPGPAAPAAAADEPARDAGHAAALAPAAGPPAVDLSPSRWPAAGRCVGRGADRADGAGDPRMGIQADPGRTARPGHPRWSVHGAADPETAADPARSAAPPHDLAAVHPQPGRDDAGVRFLPRRVRSDPAPGLCVLRDRAEQPPCPCPGA